MIPSPVNLFDRAAVPLHHRRAAIGQLGHDLAQPLCTDRHRDVHRMHHVGEQDRDLLVLRRSGGVCERCTALVAELRVGRQFGAARPTEKPRRGQPTATTCRPRQYRFTAGQRCPSYRRAISDTKFCDPRMSSIQGTGIALRPNRRHDIASAPFREGQPPSGRRLPVAGLGFRSPESPSLAHSRGAAFGLAAEILADRRRMGWLGEFQLEP